MLKTNHLLIKNALTVNEGEILSRDVLIKNGLIEKISARISPKNETVINAEGLHLLPGLIDDQVHFREPGLTHKGTIRSESRAAIAGGITSFIEMPNTLPNTTTQEQWQWKMDRAALNSAANYSFMFGGTNDNLNEILKLDPKRVPALKLFLGSSTGNMLVDNTDVLRSIFENVPLVIAVHCEEESIVKNNLKQAKQIYGDTIPVAQHPIIRSEDACYQSSSKAVALAKETGARLHVFHVSTAKELTLFSNDVPLREKKITAEACIHHLWFSDSDYAEKGNLIKWNPAIKKVADREALWEAINSDLIDVIATDHAPHTFEEKDDVYTKAPSGGPLVQHALLALLTCYHQGKITLEKIVEKACHNPAILFQISKRGYIREGYFADLVLVDLNQTTTVRREDLYYKCGWSPFEGTQFKGVVMKTFVNGELLFDRGRIIAAKAAMPLTYDR